jgi:hypothetical protein
LEQSGGLGVRLRLKTEEEKKGKSRKCSPAARTEGSSRIEVVGDGGRRGQQLGEAKVVGDLGIDGLG